MSSPSNTPGGILLILAGVWVLGQTFAGGLASRLSNLGSSSSSSTTPAAPPVQAVPIPGGNVDPGPTGGVGAASGYGGPINNTAANAGSPGVGPVPLVPGGSVGPGMTLL